MQCSLLWKYYQCQMHHWGNSYLGSLVFDLLYCSSITMHKLRLVVCIKIILKVHRDRSIFWIFCLQQESWCVCLRVEERVTGEDIPMSFEAEKKQGVEEGVYAKASLFCTCRVFYTCFLFGYGHVLLCLYKHAVYVFSPKLVESSALQGDKGTKLFPC